MTMSATLSFTRQLVNFSIAMLVAGCSSMNIPGIPGVAPIATKTPEQQVANSAEQSAQPASNTVEDDPIKDKFCDSQEESYEVLTNVSDAVKKLGPRALMQIQGGGKVDPEKLMREIS